MGSPNVTPQDQNQKPNQKPNDPKHNVVPDPKMGGETPIHTKARPPQHSKQSVLDEERAEGEGMTKPTSER